MQRTRILLAALACLVTLQSGFPQSAVVLISDDEAKLPPPKTMPLETRGVTRGPRIVLNAPEGAFRSPAALKLTFQAYGGVTIDVDSLRVLYLRTPDVDITARIKPFASAAGIDLPAATIPPGEHLLRFDIKDAQGRQTSKVVVLKAEM
jgi:hypothetical protein